MIVDSSAIIAVLDHEEGWESFYDIMASGIQPLRMSVATQLEATIVISRSKDSLHRRQLDDLIADFQVEILPVTLQQGEIARAAHLTFGKGSGHPAKLNFGDCFSYALAKHRDEPLLFKGDDFAQTDIVSALS